MYLLKEMIGMTIGKGILDSIPDKQARETAKATIDILQTLTIKNNFERICARAGWTVEIVLDDGDTLQAHERAWKAIDLFCDTIGSEKLVYWQVGAPAYLNSKTAQNKITEKRKKSLENPEGYAILFDLASGNPTPPEQWINNVQDFRFRCWLMHKEGIWENHIYGNSDGIKGLGPGMSFIRMALPISWFLEQPAEHNVGWLTTRMVEIMQPFWCTAGWGIMPAVEERNIDSDGKGQQYLYPYLQRFPGLNAIGQLTILGQTFNNSMHSVNWLNYVSDPLLERLGGRDKVKEQIKASKYLRAKDVGNCLGISAGGFPLLGDTERGIPLPSYGEAARLLKPIRVPSYYNNFVAPPPSGSSDRHAQLLAGDAYLSRFDDY
jgi:hypothetical protein